MSDDSFSFVPGGYALSDVAPISAMSFQIEGVELFAIKADGTIVRGPAFKTNDQASLEFWRILENIGYLRQGKVPLDEVAKQLAPEPGSISDAISALHVRRRIDGR